MNPTDKTQILRRIAAIPAMERGKLSAYTHERAGATGSYHRLQRWVDGKNHTRHVPAEDVPAMQAALAGYAQYQQLTEEYAELVIAETREHIADLKKNRSRPRSFSPKKRKSSN